MFVKAGIAGRNDDEDVEGADRAFLIGKVFLTLLFELYLLNDTL